MSPIQNHGLCRFAFYAATLRSLLSMNILRRHDQTQLLHEERS
jgi:hypothetical protein